MTCPKLGFGFIRAGGSGVSLDQVSSRKRFIIQVGLLGSENYYAFKMGPGEKGSSIASARVKIGSWGPKKILEGPSKAKIYPTKSYSLVFHFSHSFFLGGGVKLMQLTLLSSCKIYYTYARAVLQNYDKLMAVIGRLSLDGLLHPSQQMECMCLLAAL